MPELVISNTSPLFYLHRLRQLELLNKLYNHIIIPEAVVKELRAGADNGEDVPDITAYNWIEVFSVSGPGMPGLIMDLGPGEAEVLTLLLKTRVAW